MKIYWVVLRRSFLYSLFLLTSVTLFGEKPERNSNFTSQKFSFALDEASSRATQAYLPLKRTLSKDERKAIKKELQVITEGKDRKKLSFDQLEKAILLAHQLGKDTETILYIDQVLVIAKDATHIQKYKRLKADVVFELGKVESAEQLYQDYFDIYPGAKDIEDVHYRLIVCLSLQAREPDQDQAKTREVVRCANAFIEKKKTYTMYLFEVVKLRDNAYKLLYDHEATVFDYYLFNKQFQAAQGRLAYMRQEFGTKIASVEPDLLHKEYRLALAQKDTARAERVLALLEKKYPQQTVAFFTPKNKKSKRSPLNYVEKF